MTFKLAWPLEVIWRSRMWISPLSSWRCEIFLWSYIRNILCTRCQTFRTRKKLTLDDHGRVFSRSRKLKSHVASHRWEMDEIWQNYRILHFLSSHILHEFASVEMLYAPVSIAQNTISFWFSSIFGISTCCSVTVRVQIISGVLKRQDLK